MFYYDFKTKQKIEFDYLILMGCDDKEPGTKIYYLVPSVHDELVIFLRSKNYYDNLAIKIAYANKKVMYS